MKILIERHGSKEYAYLYSSKRVPDRQNPLVIKRYLGVYDRESGMVNPKKVRPEELLSHIHDNEFNSYDLGGTLLAWTAAKTLYLPYILNNGFGDQYRKILALALALAVDYAPVTDYRSLISKFYLDPLVDKSKMKECCLHEAFVHLTEAASVCEASVVVSGRTFLFVMNGVMNRYGRFGIEKYAEEVSSSSIVIATDRSGVPFTAKMIESMVDIGKFAQRIREISDCRDDCITVIDIPSGKGFLLPEFAMRLCNYIIRTDDHYDALADKAISLLDADAVEIRTHGELMCRVAVFRFGLHRSDDSWDIVFEDDVGFDRVSMKLNALAWIDDEHVNGSKKMLEYILGQIRVGLDSSSENVVRKELSSSKFLSEFLAITDSKGASKVTVRRKRMAELLRLSGLKLVVTDILGWEDCMEAIDAESVLHSASAPFLEYIGNASRFAYPNAFMLFLATAIRSEVRKILSESGFEELGIDDAFRLASLYQAVVINGTTYRSAIPRRTAELFRRLGVDPDDDFTFQGPPCRLGRCSSIF